MSVNVTAKELVGRVAHIIASLIHHVDYNTTGEIIGGTKNNDNVFAFNNNVHYI